ncbi:MAG: Rpn family recombination-promoting nuclease/putative transposase [Lachnospiraceae bacterium]|nr:Rpn family recombination-promoting nuclease/putative transposase [Lachnospiraceae bacterium]
MAYLILGIENQASIHYAMPPRNLLYDALEYTRQIERTAARRREDKNAKYSASEYLSGFGKSDRLIPVITLVIYFGSEEWDAPRSLHEMLAIQNKEILSFVSDYKLNLIVPAELSATDFQKFQTDLREVMQYIQYSTDRRKLSSLLEDNSRFTKMNWNAAMLLNECTKSGLKFHKSGGFVDMCKAIKEIREKEYLGGHEAGFKKGHAEGRREEHINSIQTSLTALIKNMGLSLEQAMDALDIPKEERSIYREK